MKRLAACSLLLVLAACGGAPQKPLATETAAAETASATTEPAKTASSATVKPAADAAPVRAPKQAAPAQSAALTPEKPEPAEPEIPVDDDPAQFMNGDVAALRDALGDPILIRRDGPAEVWQFRGDACTLDLFLYPGDGGALAVKHVDLRGDAPDENRACLARMLRAHIVAADG